MLLKSQNLLNQVGVNIRWRMEEYHQALKTGCVIEQRPLHNTQGLLALLGFLAIVAVRWLRLRSLARAAPNTPVRQVVEPEFVEAIRRLRGGSAATMTVD